MVAVDFQHFMRRTAIGPHGGAAASGPKPQAVTASPMPIAKVPPEARPISRPSRRTAVRREGKCGNDFTLEFGDIDEGFYDSLCSMFLSVAQTLLKRQDQELISEFLPSLEAELYRVDGQIGWGYPDELSDYLSDLRDALESRLKAVHDMRLALGVNCSDVDGPEPPLAIEADAAARLTRSGHWPRHI